ncbi:protein outspread-like isoform X5 [Scylla paramamosain]|uniref:protein outspread-like isoform X5 n=1 Tax=Scylla paramamosain TaxID=85552 RepID=UPI003082B8E2
MSGLKGAECRKFQANIFNKSKCTNCFKQREEHSPEALESNRASRKVSKCGYLFVAPDWDFTIPLNRTKRWQRRWFVLYDDGELTYSLDDHPATIPQGVVDMNRVLEVSCAEEVTGNQFSLAITAPDRVTFIKATCKEEAKWWMDVLSVFPCTLKQQGRHKRNATFPGIKTTTAKQTRHTAATMAPTAFETAAGQRVRFHSCTTDPMIESRPQSAPAPTLEAEEDVFPTKDSSPPASSTLQPSTHSSTNTSRCFSTPISTSTPLSSLPPSSTPFSSLPPSSARLLREEQKENTPYIGESPPTQDKMSHKLRARRAPRRTEGRGVGLTQPRTGEVSRRQLISDLEETKREEKLKDIADSLTRPRGSALSYVSSKPGAGDVKPTRESDAAEELDPPPNSANSQSPDTTSPSHPDHVRGDPDGCGLELSPPYPASPDLQRVDLPAEDLLYIKKGWLMKQSLSQEWIKYWFVLRGTALMFYRDPGAEDSGILAGIIDLSLAKSVEESEVARNYGFTIATWEEKKYIFSAVTSGIRANWVQALRNAANLKEQKDRPLTLGEKIEREIVAKKEKTNSQGRSTFESMAAERERDTKFHTESRASSNNSHFAFSSDEEGDEEDDDEDDDDDDEEEDYRTASETSIRLQQASEDICDWGNSRSDSTKQSRSSPLTSRRSAKEDYLTSKLAATSTTTTTTTTTTTATNSSSSSGSGGRDVCCSETGSLHSISDLDDRLQPEKDGPAGTSTTTLPASGDALLVDLLETQVESLKAKLEQTQTDYLELHKEHVALKTKLRVGGGRSVVVGEGGDGGGGEGGGGGGAGGVVNTSSSPLPSNSVTGAHHHHLHHSRPHPHHHYHYHLATTSPPDSDPSQQPLSGRSRAKLEMDLAEARQSIASLKAELNRLRKRLEMCEGDLDRSEREADQLRRDKDDVVQDRNALQRRANNLEIQVKELLDRVEEQEHDLSEKAAATNQLNELRKKYGELLDHFSAQQAEMLAGLDWKQQYSLLEKKSLKERDEWEEKLSKQEKKFMELSASQETRHQEAVRRLNRSLQEAEKKIQGLASELEEERTAASTPKKLSSTTSDTDVRQQNQQLSIQLEHLTTELSRMRDTLKSEKSEVYKWKDLVKELRSLLDGKNDEIERKREELDEMRENLKTTQRELEHTTDRLHRGIEENENLCTKVRELERTLRQDKERRASSNLSISSSRERFTSKKALPRIDSLSDLTNVDLSSDPEEMSKEQLVEHCGEVRVRLERAIGEIRALKRQVREGQEQQDQLELSNLQLRQDMKGSKGDFNSQLNLMTCRIQDLTNKLTNSEKQVRVLRQKMSRAESRDRRRTQSLKGRESFTLSRDMEAKLGQLEAKLEQLLRPQDQCALPEVDEEKGKTEEKVGGEAGKMARRSRSFEESTKSSRLRRKSLDSPGSSDAMKAIVRLNALEAKVSELTSDAPVPASGGDNGIPSLSETAPAGTSKPSSTRARSPPHSATSPLRSVPHARSPIRSPSVSRKTLRSPRATPEKTTKVSRSDSEIRHLRERLGALDKVITTLQTQLGECVSWAGAVECVCSCGAPGLSSLQQRLGAALHLAQLRHSSVDQSQVARVKPLALKLQDMLRDKLAEFAGRRDHLKNEGKWTRDVQVKMFAERLAYETLVLSQLAQVMQASQRPSMYEASAKLQELVEAHRKLSFLEKKLTNPDFDMDTLSPLDFYTSLLAEKLVVQGEVVNPSSRRASSSPPPVLGETCRDLQARLLERERNLAGLLTRYKEEKLHQIAVVMARETITGTGPGQDDTVLVEEVRMRQVWTLAQELVSQELANTEAGQSLLRLSHLLSPDGPPPTGAVPWPTAASLEHCHRAAEESLRQEMEEAVFTLSNKYEAVLARHRAGDTDVLQSVSTTMDALLAEFAAVTAQKAVIDGQLAVVQGEGGEAAPEALAIVEEVKDTVGSASDVVASEAHLLMFLGGRDSSLESLVQPALDQAEFTFMYNKATMQGAAEVAKLLQEVANAQASLDVKDTSSLSTSSIASTSTTTTTTTTSSSTTLTASKDGSGESSAVLSMGAGSSAAKTPSSPKARRKSEGRRSSRRSSDITGMAEGCRQCEELRQEVAKLKRSMDLRRAREREVECKQCLTHLANIKALEEEHQAAVAALKAQHQQELARVGMLGESSGGPVSTTDGELTELQRRLSLLEEGYEAQITALKHQYEEALGSQPDLCEEKVRQRYQLEIEHLRGLCEKGLGAMENSHKRMLMEMEEKHCRELAALQAEKEQALAEETQATLAALDAMRKAHESEVQREIAKFKEEFIRKMQSSHDLTAIHKEHEAEMEDIRREILSLSQKYSVKCLESASLEEKLDALTRQLADVNKQLFDLQARNKQLKTHLSAQVSQLQAEGKRDAESQLKLCEAELGLMKEEVARLTQQLHQTQTHESDLGELCRQLGQFLKAERQLRTDEVASLRDKLEAILVTAAAMQEQWRTGESGGPEEGGKQSPTRGAPTPPLNRSSKELIRSPSCPRLSGVSSFLSGGPWQGRTGPPTPPAPTPDLPSPLAGMVATRKKVFETRHALMEPL